MVPFATQYPHLDWWIEFHSFIELGEDGYSHSMLRILDEYGTCFEDKNSKTLDDALAAGEAFYGNRVARAFSGALEHRNQCVRGYLGVVPRQGPAPAAENTFPQ